MTQDQTLDSEHLFSSFRTFISDDRPQRFIIGFLFGVAFFLIQAGVAEVLLARNAVCLENLNALRVAPNPNEACLSELLFFLARGMSQGLIGALNPSMSVFAVWLILALIYGLIGGGLAQLPLRVAIAIFLAVHVLLLMSSMALDFFSQFIVFNLTDTP